MYNSENLPDGDFNMLNASIYLLNDKTIINLQQTKIVDDNVSIVLIVHF